MKKLLALLVVALSSVTLHAQTVWTFENIDPATGLRTGRIYHNRANHNIEPGASLVARNLRDADLRGVDLFGANLRDADLRGADLSGAHLRGANITSADLRGANLRDANLQNTRLTAILSEADLGGADLRGADLTLADLFGADVDDADHHFFLRQAVEN